MSISWQRILLATAAALVLSPMALLAQSSQSGEGQPQAQNKGQQQNGPAQRHGARWQAMQRMAMLAQKLNLTDEQKKQFQQIGRQTWQQTQTIRQDSSLSDAGKKQKLQELHKQANQQRLGLLTAEQKEQLKQLREQRKKDHAAEDKDKTSSNKTDEDDLFAGMVSDDDDQPPSTGPVR